MLSRELIWRLFGEKAGVAGVGLSAILGKQHALPDAVFFEEDLVDPNSFARLGDGFGEEDMVRPREPYPDRRITLEIGPPAAVTGAKDGISLEDTDPDARNPFVAIRVRGDDMQRPPVVDLRRVDGRRGDRNWARCTRQRQEACDPETVFHAATLPGLGQASPEMGICPWERGRAQRCGP